MIIINIGTTLKKFYNRKVQIFLLKNYFKNEIKIKPKILITISFQDGCRVRYKRKFSMYQSISSV